MGGTVHGDNYIVSVHGAHFLGGLRYPDNCNFLCKSFVIMCIG